MPRYQPGVGSRQIPDLLQTIRNSGTQAVTSIADQLKMGRFGIDNPNIPKSNFPTQNRALLRHSTPRLQGIAKLEKIQPQPRTWQKPYGQKSSSPSQGDLSTDKAVPGAWASHVANLGSILLRFMKDDKWR